MYKKRIDDWQLHKNCTASEKEEILRCIEMNRELSVDLGEPIMNGRTVKMHIIERYQKEKRKVKSPRPSMADTRSTKRACLQRTKVSTSISFSRIEDPAEYRNFENLLFQIDQYYNAKLENDPHAAWDAWQQSSRPQSVELAYVFQGATYTCKLSGTWDIFNRYIAAVGLLTNNHPREAWRMIQEGAEMVRPILAQESPVFIEDFLAYLSQSPRAAYDGLEMRLLHLISGIAIVIHGDRHPISILCQLLQTLHKNQDVIKLGMSKIRDVLKWQLGQTHSASTFAQQRLCFMLLRQRRYDEAERAILDLISTCERVCGWNDYHTRSCLCDLADLYYIMCRDSEAEDVLVDVLQRGKERGDRDYINICAKKIQGEIYSARGDYEAAEAYLWSALSSRLFGYGPRDPETVGMWVEYKRARDLLQKRHETFPEILEEPTRRHSRTQSSSRPPVARRKKKAGFCYEAPV
jgi:hypothetical protein